MEKIPEDYGVTKINLPSYGNRTELIGEEKGKKAPQYIAGLTVSLAALSMGTTLAWTSQISTELKNGALGFNMTDDELGWVSSLMHLGAAALSLFTGSLCDAIGRKLCMLLLILPATLGWSLIIWAQSVAMVYCGRFITGMVGGSFCFLASIYTSEIAEKDIRGALGSYTQLMISSGILFANVVATFLNVVNYTITCAAIPLVFGSLFVFMPETPVYLIKKRKLEQARVSLKKLRGNQCNLDMEMKEIEIALLKNRFDSGWKVLRESLKQSSCRRACVIGVGLMIFKSMNGMDAITAYTSYIFESAHMELNPKIGTIILNFVQVLTAIFQSLVVDKCGRRILLWLSAAIMSVCLGVVGLSLLLKEKEIIGETYFIYVDYLPLVALVIFMVAFSLGMGPIPWLMMGEIFPVEIKSLASSLTTFLSWIASFAVTKLFMVIDSAWGGEIAFFLFALITCVTVVFILILVPETKNKSFDEIQREL